MFLPSNSLPQPAVTPTSQNVCVEFSLGIIFGIFTPPPSPSNSQKRSFCSGCPTKNGSSSSWYPGGDDGIPGVPKANEVDALESEDVDPALVAWLLIMMEN